MTYKIQEQEFIWVSVVGTQKCKTNRKHICICSYPLGHNTFIFLTLWRTTSVSALHPCHVWRVFIPKLLMLHTILVILPIVLQCQGHPSFKIIYNQQTYVLGGTRFLSRIYRRSERQEGERRDFLCLYPVTFTLITEGNYGSVSGIF